MSAQHSRYCAIASKSLAMNMVLDFEKVFHPVPSTNLLGGLLNEEFLHCHVIIQFNCIPIKCLLAYLWDLDAHLSSMNEIFVVCLFRFRCSV